MNLKMTFAAITAAMLFASCGKSLEERAREKISSLTESAELGTVEYSIKKIIKANDTHFIGDRKILFSCKATMKAGVDLADFSVEDAVIDANSKTIEVTLPQPKILSLNMPAEGAKLEYEKVGAMRFNFTADERNNLLTQGEKAILDDAANLGILGDAKKNAILFFESLLAPVGFEKVVVKFKEQ